MVETLEDSGGKNLFGLVRYASLLELAKKAYRTTCKNSSTIEGDSTFSSDTESGAIMQESSPKLDECPASAGDDDTNVEGFVPLL